MGAHENALAPTFFLDSNPYRTCPRTHCSQGSTAPSMPTQSQCKSLGSIFGRLTEKICRGIFFLEDRAFIEPPYEILHYIVASDETNPILDALRTHGTIYTREPGITVCRAVAEDNPNAAVFSIEIWGQIKVYASVLESERD